MSASSFNEQMEKLLECNICLERLDNPKVLNCTHSFCKSCLDNILEFRDDGSAVINCPLRCNEKTIIGIDKTTNDLKASVQFKNVIEFLGEREDGPDNKPPCLKCYNHPKCDNTVSVYCSICFRQLCAACKTNHTHNGRPDGVTFAPIKYNKDTNDVQPWCDEHDTYSAYICQDGFICLYCKARTHSNHRYDKIETLSQQIISWVEKQLSEIGKLEDLLLLSKQRSKEEYFRIKDVFTREVKKRKFISMQDYLKKLNEEEEKLLYELDSAFARHMLTYPLSTPHAYVENKPNFEVCADREYILKSVQNIISAEVTVPNICFTYRKETADDSSPLGVLEVFAEEGKLTEGTVTVSASVPECELIDASMQALLGDLKQMKLEVAGGTCTKIKAIEKGKMDDPTLATDFQEDEEDKLIELLTTYENQGSNKQKMLFLCSLMKANDLLGFKLLWNAIPAELLKLQSQGYSLLHVASTINKPDFVRIILEAGADVNETVEGGTALFAAAVNGSLPTVKLLVEYHADILLKFDDYNVIDFAKQANYAEIVEFLVNHLEKNDMNDNGIFSKMTIEELKKEDLLAPDSDGDSNADYLRDMFGSDSDS